MKTRILGVLLLGICTLMGCKEQQSETTEPETAMPSPDYGAFDKKVAVIQSLYAAHEAEDLEAMGALMSDTLRFSPPYYNGNTWLGKSEMLAGIQGYHDNFDDIKWEGGILLPDGTMETAYWSGSVFPEASASSSPDAIRVYGTWTATHTETGKSVGVKFYTILSINEDGQVTQASEYFDVNGLAAQIAESEE